MDDIIYIDLRWKFIKPAYAFFGINIPLYNKDLDNLTQEQIDGINEVYAKLGLTTPDNFFETYKPQFSPRDGIRAIMKEEDFTAKEDHYFNFLKEKLD